MPDLFTAAVMCGARASLDVAGGCALLLGSGTAAHHADYRIASLSRSLPLRPRARSLRALRGCSLITATALRWALQHAAVRACNRHHHSAAVWEIRRCCASLQPLTTAIDAAVCDRCPTRSCGHHRDH
ncbi:hypothetical protein Dimus_024671, partial [Dionaea muscipula]